MRSRYEAVSERMNDVFYRGFSEEEAVRFEALLERVYENLKE